MNRIDEQESMKIHPLIFWAEQTDRLPILARLAAFILAIPATSSYIERIFLGIGIGPIPISLLVLFLNVPSTEMM
jgi:hypothetical protein